MLVLTAKKNEAIIIGERVDGKFVELCRIANLKTRGDSMRLGFHAPETTIILREKVILKEKDRE